MGSQREDRLFFLVETSGGLEQMEELSMMNNLVVYDRIHEIFERHAGLEDEDEIVPETTAATTTSRQLNQ